MTKIEDPINRRFDPFRIDPGRLMRSFNLVSESAIRQAIKDLNLPKGSRGLDVGCGGGIHTLWLAEKMGYQGKVIGIDILPMMLKYARENALSYPHISNVDFIQANMHKLPFEDNSFDWVWAADTLHTGPEKMGCPLQDPVPVVKEIARVVKPGGKVAVSFWCYHSFLPGHPELEARLRAMLIPVDPHLVAERPELAEMRTLGWLHKAGLERRIARSYSTCVQAPVEDEKRICIQWCLHYLGEKLRLKMEPRDWDEYKRLCSFDSPDYILDHPDFYGFIVISVFSGTVRESGK